jgi:hypothetical protein
MGWHGGGGTAERAPEIFFNHAGAMPWSNKKATELSDEDKLHLLEFASEFGEDQGHRAGLQKEDRPGFNLFDPGFLDGQP